MSEKPEPTESNEEDGDTFDLADEEPTEAPAADLARAYGADDGSAPSGPVPPPDQPAAKKEVAKGMPSAAADWNDPAKQPPPQDPAAAARRREESRKEAALRLAEEDAKKRKIKLIGLGVVVVIGLVVYFFVLGGD